ncbi:MAG TPA: hypothetical protein PLP29_14330 [Candidatus Ozemobacteraceae bacterium]|nr:hypothetical protein [Candidatus Ozemobacteraceae bacterium]
MPQIQDGIVRGNPRRGSLGLYAMAMGLVTLFLVLAFFFPQYFRMKSGIYRISCKEIRRKIEVAVANYDSNNTRSIVQPGKPIDVDHLKATGFLSEVQTCPENGKYLFGPQGEVLCTIHRPTAKQAADADSGS